jgi:hypothetical protein
MPPSTDCGGRPGPELSGSGRFSTALWTEESRRGPVVVLGATLAGWREIGPPRTDESYPQIRAEPTVVRVPVLYLCSRSSRRCGYVEKHPFPCSAPTYSSTGGVENLGIIHGDLWMKKSCPHPFHSLDRVLHRFSPEGSPALGITTSPESVTTRRPAGFIHRSYPQTSTGVENPGRLEDMSCMSL